MKYMLLVYLEENAMTETERAECYVKSAQLARDIHSKGQYLDAAPLHAVSTATSIRMREGRRLVTDGPFAETREQLGGYYLIDCASVDEALKWAKQCPVTMHGGGVELRPVMVR